MNTDVKQEIVQSLTDQKILLKSVKIRNQYKHWWKKLLAYFFLIPRYKTKKIYLSELFPGTVIRLLGVIKNLRAAESISDVEIYKMMENNIPLFVEFLAHGLHNNADMPPKWLYDALNFHFSIPEMQEAVTQVYRRLDMQTFFVISGSLISLQELENTMLGEEQPTN